MALTHKLVLASLLISFFLLHTTTLHAHPSEWQVGEEEVEAKEQSVVVDKIDCDGACSGRCRLSSRPRLCKRACGTCCQRCNCVPPGTSGNQNLCPCYATLTTHGGKRKCP